MDQTVEFETAEKIILRWDSTASEEARERMIFDGDRREADRYLQAVDELQRSMESVTVSGDHCIINSAVQIAMARLEDEFRNILVNQGSSVESDLLLDPCSSSTHSSSRTVEFEDEDDTEDGGPSKEEEQREQGEGSQGTSSTYRSTSCIDEIDLIPSEAIYNLRSIAERMISGGYMRECIQVYGSARKSAVDESFRRLRIEKLSIGDVQRLDWDALGPKIRRWISAAKVCVRILFASEKRLCEQIFEGLDPAADDACFMETIKGPAIQLFNFAEAISISQRSPEKLFKILDLHDALSDLLPDVDMVFRSKSSESIRVQASEIRSRLAEAARGILSEFENAVQREPSIIPVPGGTIHPLTRYVMNYIGLISDYKQTLVELIVSKPSPASRNSDELTTPEIEIPEPENPSPLAFHLLWIIVILESNLQGKSRHYKDASLAHIFLMNNVHYIVQKVTGNPDLEEMIGVEYLKKQTWNFRQSATNYQRLTWWKILHCLRDEGIHVSGSFSSGVSKTALRERFKAFNSMFDEAHRTQATWSVPDSQLREELRISISEILIPAYRSFLGRFRSHIESGKHPEMYIKYSVEDLETTILDLFEGNPASVHFSKGAAGKPAEIKPRSNSSKGGAAEPFPLEVLKDLLGYDREHANLPLLVIFVKSFSWDILGVKPTGAEGRKTVEEDGVATATNGDTQDDGIEEHEASSSADQPLTEPELRERFRNVLKKYFDDVKAHIVRDQKSIQSQARRNAEAYVKSGEVFEDRQANYEKQVKAQERLVSNAQVIADAIGADMPDLKDADDSLGASNGSIGLVKTGDYLRSMGDGAGIWEDEDERRFYENLVDLKGKVPPILLEDGKKKKPDSDEQVGKKIDQTEVSEAPKPIDPADDQSTAIANKTIGAQVDALLARLPELTNKDIVDQTAIDFCFLNSKASRNRLVKALTEVPKGRSDLLPSWARLVATLGRYMPDVPKGLVEYLDAEFRSLQRRKEKDFLGQVRLSNIRYLAELTKFGIVPEHVVFHCLKVSLDDFSRMNIEILCNLIENCGRYLLRNPETAPRMASFLETLQRKKSVQHIGQPERMLIDNAVYYVDPPERPAIEQKERTPMELFIRKLIYVDMTKRNYSKILKQIRRLHWEETEVVAILEKVFSKPGKVKYGSVHLLGILLSALYRYHPAFVVKVIDNAIESVSFGLEQNDYRFSQRRVAEVKYLGELYNYRMLEHPVIFDTMYKIMTFGYGGPPIPGRFNPLDPPDDFFRIRLVATMLETCGMFFNRGAAGKKLDYFLSFFQYYVFTKASLPMDIEFTVQDTFALTRPQWKLATNLEEAAKAFQLAVAQDQKTAGIDKTIDMDDATSGPSSDDDNGDNDDAEDDDESASEEDDVEQEVDDDSDRESTFDEEAIVVTRQEEEVDPEDEAEFEREYAKMMAESLESRKFERKQLFDVPLPVRAKNKETAPGEGGNGHGETASGNTMAFSLLTKRGNRQQTRTVELPSDSTFAIAMKNQQQAEREEQQRIKNLVLNYDLQQSEDQDGGNERPATYYHNRLERSNKDRGQRVRKLQLSDVDWT